MSPTLNSTPTLLLILSSLSLAAAFVNDTDGDPLRNGGTYYIIPQSIGFGGGLTLKPKTNTSPCPLYISPDSDEGSSGTPVVVSTPLRIAFIQTGVSVSFAFEDIPNVCQQPLGWRVVPDEKTGRSYIATGGSVSSNRVFKIVKEGLQVNEYKIKYVNGDKDVGLFGNDSLLGLTDEIPLPVAFVKASKGLTMKV